jgi:hypothetical protein
MNVRFALERRHSPTAVLCPLSATSGLSLRDQVAAFVALALRSMVKGLHSENANDRR